MLNRRKDRMMANRWHPMRVLLITFTTICLLISSIAANMGVVQANATRTPFADVYVDWRNTSGVEDGSSAHPFNTVAEAVATVSNNGTVFIYTGSYGETLTLNSAMTLRSEGGMAIIGMGGSAFRYQVYLTPVFLPL
jgi:hypothetical protein